MKTSSLLRRGTLTLAACCLASSPLFAEDTTPPVVATPISDVTVSAGSAPTVVKLKKTFALSGVTGNMVRMSTSAGNIDVELFADKAPQTVAIFLKYANATGDNTTGVASYTNTLIQRAVPSFIVQGGGFYVNSSGQIDQISGRPTIPSEAGVSNTRGTLAMALSSGPNSATGDWFFNVVDNVAGAMPDLDDSSDGGPFTVFGRALGDLATLDAIEALPQEDFSSSLGGGFTNVPLVNFTSGEASVDNLVYTNSITALPLVPTVQGGQAALTLKAKNTNPSLVTATLSGKKLTLSYAAGQTGSATITVVAKDTAGTKAKASFTVTVR